MRKTDTREYVTQALFALLDKKEMKDTTVCELVAKAGISRATFYRSYLDMYQVIDEQLAKIAQGMTDKAMMSSADIRDNTLQIFRLLLATSSPSRFSSAVTWETGFTEPFIRQRWSTSTNSTPWTTDTSPTFSPGRPAVCSPHGSKMSFRRARRKCWSCFWDA